MKRDHLQDLAAERALLGLLQDFAATDGAEAARALVEASGPVSGDFAAIEHGDTYRACMELLARGQAPEPVGLWSLLKPSEAVRRAGGDRWLVQLSAEVRPMATAALFAGHAQTIEQLALRRRALDSLRKTAEQLHDLGKEVSATLGAGAEAWGALVNRQRTLGTAEQDVFRLCEQLDAVQKGHREPVLRTGVELLDDVIAGLQPTLTIVGALPGIGKSALLATIIANLGRRKVKVGMFSLEDERTWLTRRLVAMDAAIPLQVLSFRPLGKHQAERVDEANPRVYEILRHVVIDDRLGLTAQEVVQSARDMVLNHGCRAVFVDHLGEIRFPNRSERHDLDIAEALSQLRGIAKQYGVPVVVACHIRRRDGLGPENEPRLTDFANSAAIERMARVALGLSKPNKDTLKVSILKQTNGSAGNSVDLEFVGPAGLVESKSGQMAQTTYEEDERWMMARRGAA